LDEARLRWLFLDLNSYFASVEQQENPRLRGRPVIVRPAPTEHTCAIAASTEAKAFGIRTGTMVAEARRLCPGLVVVEARHDVYVEYHHRIVAEIERHLHVTRVMSIDEVACELLGRERLTANALTLAHEVQAGVQTNVGECLRSSVGLAPSVLLAKTASDMKKPGGLTVLGAHELPGPLLSLTLRDFSGIGRNMAKRLEASGIADVAALWALTPGRARAVWGSIMGERFCYGLHGIDPPDLPEKPPQSFGHSHVLGGALRNHDAAYRVGRRLLARAASRLRRAGFRAGGLSLYLRLADGPSRDGALRLEPSADTFRFLRAYDELWRGVTGGGRMIRPLHVGVTLFDIRTAAETPDLFGWAEAANDNPKSLRLSAALDRLNQRYGSETVAIGPRPQGLSRYMGAKIAFNRVPAMDDFRG